jgi:hypothetical protein
MLAALRGVSALETFAAGNEVRPATQYATPLRRPRITTRETAAPLALSTATVRVAPVPATTARAVSV